MPSPFSLRDLSVISYANGYTHWHYKGQPSVALTEGFFAPASDLMAPGDTILISNADGAAFCFLRNGTAEPMLTSPASKELAST